MPPEPSGRPDLFTLEAGEALQRLGRLLGGDQVPGDDAVRAARVLRGASLLGGPPDFTRAAAALEAAVKAVAERALTWEPRLAEVLRGAVEGLEVLMRRPRPWIPADAESALRMAGEIDRAAHRQGGETPRPFGRRTSDRQEPGVRVFLAREATVVAGAIDRLARDPEGLGNQVAIQHVLRTTQPLRGVAFLGEVPPLAEVLEVTERLLDSLARGTPPAPRTAEALSQLAGALTRAARDIATGADPALDAPELLGAANHLREVVTSERDIVSIEGLFREGDPAPIVHRGAPTPAELPGPDAAIAMHSLAGRLSQAADQLEQAGAGALGTLREMALLLHLQAGLPARPQLPVDRMLAALVRALARGAAGSDPRGFQQALRQAASALTTLAEGSAESNAPSLMMVTNLFETLPGRPGHWEPPTAPASPEAVPIETLLYATPAADEAGIVPIEALLAAATPAGSASGTGGLDLLEASLQDYEALLTGAASRPAAGPQVVAPPADGAVVPIETLLYKGRRALERAAVVRHEIDAAIAAIRAERRLEPLLRELMDLIPLALDDAR